MKRVLVQFDFPNLSPQQYDNIWKELRATGHSHPFGLVYHVGAPKANDGWSWVDVWETEEHFNDFFAEELKPLFTKLGVPAARPRILPARYVYEVAYNDSVI